MSIFKNPLPSAGTPTLKVALTTALLLVILPYAAIAKNTKLEVESPESPGWQILLLQSGFPIQNSGELEAWLKSDIEKAKSTKDTATMASDLKALGLVYMSLDRDREAKKALKTSLALTKQRRQQLPSRDIAYNLGSLYAKEGNNKEAEFWLTRSIKSDPADGTSRRNDAIKKLGAVYTAGKQYDKAIATWSLLLPGEANQNASNTYLQLEILSALADIYERQGNYLKAEDCLKQCVDMSEEQLRKYKDPTHCDTATPWVNLAIFYQRNDKEALSEAADSSALKIRESGLGLRHPDVAESSTRMAIHYLARKDYNNAEPLLERALKIYEASFGPNYKSIAHVADSLGKINQAEGNKEKAINWYNRAIEIADKTPNFSTVERAGFVKNLAAASSSVP